MDKVMIFTDCQLWDSNNSGSNMQKLWNVYKVMTPGAKLYLFDLAGYGNTPVRAMQNDVFLIAGWSDKVFDMLEAIEKGESAVQKIKEMVL
jgi:60 kDa SS-A/Ro ribonucleoprotein